MTTKTFVKGFVLGERGGAWVALHKVSENSYHSFGPWRFGVVT